MVSTQKHMRAQVQAKKRDGSTASPIAPQDDHDPQDKYGSYSGQSPQPRKGGRSGGVVGQTRQRFGTSQSKKKDSKPKGRAR